MGKGHAAIRLTAVACALLLAGPAPAADVAPLPEPDKVAVPAPESEDDDGSPVPESTVKARRAAADSSWQYDKHYFRYRAVPGSSCRVVGKDRMEIDAGDVLVEPTRAAVVVTPCSQTFIKHRACVLFRVQKGSTRCLVLWDNGMGSVSVVCRKHHAKLGPGDEALVADHDPSPREIYESDEIGRRRIRVHMVGDNHTVATSEFSLLHALERVPVLYEVFRSPDAQDQALKEKILKTAAVLNMVTYGHGSYSSGTHF